MKSLWGIVLLFNLLLGGSALSLSRDSGKQSDDAQGDAFGAVILICILVLLDIGAVITGIVHYFIS